MKKIFGFLGIAMIATAMFMNTNAVNGSTGDTSLTNLLTINSANAECEPSTIEQLNTGKCSLLTGNCYSQAEQVSGPERCDPFAPNQG